MQAPLDRVDALTIHYGQVDPVGGPCSGDSGGPALRVSSDGVERVAAVTSYGDKACQEFGVSGRVSAVYDGFIERYLAGQPITRTCDQCAAEARWELGKCMLAVNAGRRYATSSAPDRLRPTPRRLPLTPGAKDAVMLPYTKGAVEMRVFIKLAALVLLPSLAVGCAGPRGGGTGLHGVQYSLWMPSSIVDNSTQILGYAAMLIIALTVVRRHRRDASLFLAASAILHLIATLVPIGIGLYLVGQHQSYDPYKYTWLNSFRAAGDIQTAALYLRPVAMVLLLAGILRASYKTKAARPPKSARPTSSPNDVATEVDPPKGEGREP